MMLISAFASLQIIKYTLYVGPYYYLEFQSCRVESCFQRRCCFSEHWTQEHMHPISQHRRSRVGSSRREEILTSDWSNGDRKLRERPDWSSLASGTTLKTNDRRDNNVPSAPCGTWSWSFTRQRMPHPAKAPPLSVEISYAKIIINHSRKANKSNCPTVKAVTLLKPPEPVLNRQKAKAPQKSSACGHAAEPFMLLEGSSEHSPGSRKKPRDHTGRLCSAGKPLQYWRASCGSGPTAGSGAWRSHSRGDNPMGTCRESESGCLNPEEVSKATEVLGSSPVPDQILSVGVIGTGGLGCIAFLHQRPQAILNIQGKQYKKGRAQWKEDFARGVWLTEVRTLIQGHGGIEGFTRSLQVR